MIKIHNLIPDFIRFIEALEKGEDFDYAFKKYYFSPNQKVLKPFYGDVKKIEKGFSDFEKEFNLKKAKQRLEKIKERGCPEQAEKIIKKAEKFYQKKLTGEMVLFFSFSFVDGYTRFNKGKNTIYIGMDLPETEEDYYNILISHELNHLTRDSQEKILKSFGASKKLSHKAYLKKMTFAEHLVNEGLASYFSSRMFPNRKPWQYVYYSKRQYDWCQKNQLKIEKKIKQSLRANSDWGGFYQENFIEKGSPEMTQYFFGINLIKKAVKKYHLQKLTSMPAEKIVSEFIK
ncbi:MAG: hypothetical protein COU40_03875 [Candidatus Moranbacteria bacterium CG10_big_fil_rev_8_21_14_0_10_35_21]|nr:MAG: hypothetical protein COU40_03875 [Candidatus Moranbacteria bacterium CG10_big_fil_rev_8_21_14_0_10_35_21]